MPMNRFVLRRLAHLDSEARALEDRGQHAPAIELWEEVCRLAGETLGNSHSWRISRLLDLAASYRRHSDAHKAQTTYREVIERSRLRHGQGKHESPTDLARGLNGLGVLYCEIGKQTSAITLFEEALTVSRQRLSEANPGHAAILSNLASAHHASGYYRRAEACYLEALVLHEQSPTPRLLEQARCRLDLAELAADEGSVEKSERQVEKALSLYRTIYGHYDPILASALLRIASLYRRICREIQAVDLYEEAIEILQCAVPAKEGTIAHCLDQLSDLRQHS